MSAQPPRGLDVRTARTTHRPGEGVRLLVDAATEGSVVVSVTHLGDPVTEQRVTLRPGRQEVDLGTLPEGSYSVVIRGERGEADETPQTDESGYAATAFDVLADPRSRPRYGFLADFGRDRDDDEELLDSLRAHHITVLQLYDWMYRHADLVPPTDDFADALGRPLSLAIVRRLVDAVHGVGATALGYAAVYGAGEEYASAHPEQVLRHRDGSPWTLADFLWIMDITPGSPWVRHIVQSMSEAVATVGFDGLHLDQYGHPKVAVTAAGESLDLADAFPAMVDAVRAALPSSTLIFNNVNDFPTRRTIHAQQDATYVEVWPPHDDYADLVRLVEVARDLAPTRPVILAAYLEPFASAGGPAEVMAAALALATVWASGGQYLLFGEVAGVLVDPYYPRYATLGAEAVSVLRRLGDFAVANGDLLIAVDAAETSASVAGGVNEDIAVTGAPVSVRPVAGHLWLRTSRVGGRLVVQLVDYRDQPDSRWNRSGAPATTVTGLTLRVRVVSAHPQVRFGHPDGGPALHRLGGAAVVDDGDTLTVTVPDFDTWAVLVVDE